mmetsp:Transcript_116224/g.292206  ORF Transcript_116224/g.292206 Transcript_116224/m.292206 type:complete len:657 (+) Transcript_116224:83-2053(+)
MASGQATLQRRASTIARPVERIPSIGSGTRRSASAACLGSCGGNACSSTCGSPRGNASGVDHETYCNAVKADVLRLHELGASACEGGKVAAQRGAAPPIEEQIAKALFRFPPAGGSASGNPALACGSLLELLLTKVSEAAMCILEQTDASSQGIMPSVAKSMSLRRSSGPPFIIAPLVAALERLRWLQEFASSQAGRSGQARCVMVPAASTASIASTGVGQKSRPTKSSAVQTDIVLMPPDGHPIAEPSRPPKSEFRTCGVQTIAAASSKGKRDFGAQTIPVCKSDVAVQMGPTLVPPLEGGVAQGQIDAKFHDAGFQTDAAEHIDKGAQTELRSAVVHCKDARIQTEDPALAATNATVRILRIARMERRAAAASAVVAAGGTERGSDLSSKRGGDDPRSSSTREQQTSSRSKASRSTSCPKSPGMGLCVPPSPSTCLGSPVSVRTAGTDCDGSSEDVTGDVSKQRSVDSTTPQLPQPPPLRCPLGHGMQWFRERRRDGSQDDAEVAPLICSVCSASLIGPVGFHCCALCFRETGERHSICGACTRDPISMERYVSRRRPLSGDVALSSGSMHRQLKPSLALGKSASAGSIGVHLPSPLLRQRPDVAAARAREWSLVSAAGSATSLRQQQQQASSSLRASRPEGVLLDGWEPSMKV